MPSQYSQGLLPWNSGLHWNKNILNRGTQNLFDFLKLDPTKLYGQETGYLTDQLKGTIEGGLDPALAQLLSVGKRNISQLGDTARRNTNQQLASSGFRGAGANLNNEIFQSQGNALEGLNANIGQLGLQNRQNAIAQLLGLNQMQTGVNTGIAGQQAGIAQYLTQLAGGREGMEAQIKASQTDFGDVLMGILGTGVGGLAGGFGAGWSNSLFSPSPK